VDLVGMDDGVSFLGNVDHFAFAWVEGHPIPIPTFIVQKASGPYTNNKIHTNTA